MKRIAILFCLLIALLSLTSCSQQEMYERPSPTATSTPEPTPVPTEAPKELDNGAQVGDIVALGNYAGDPITWYVINRENDKAQLLSQFVIETMEYSNYSDSHDDGKQSRWQYSPVRDWLNGDFYETAFSEDEKARILLSSLQTASLDKNGRGTTDNTEDKIYLLAPDEAETLEENIRIAKATQHAIITGTEVGSAGIARWWTRSIYKNGYVGYMSREEKVNYFVPSYAGTGVRPAMRVEIE